MKEFKVPVRGVKTHLRLSDGSDVDATLYVAEAMPGGPPSRLIDRLNDESEQFVGVSVDDRQELLTKAGIVWAGLHENEVEQDEATSAAPAHQVCMTMQDGEILQGVLHYVMRPERSRLLDYCNAAPQFLALEGETLRLVNRNYILRIVEEESGDD